MRPLPLNSDFSCALVLCGLLQDLKVSQDVSQSKWQSQRAHQSIKLYEFLHAFHKVYRKDHCNFRENEQRKTISIKCAKKQKATSISDEVERRSAIPRGMTYLVHHGKVLTEKRKIEENNIGIETTIETSLRLLGGTDKSESMDTLESEED